MGSYKLFFKKSAEKELRQIQSGDLKRILEKISALAGEPRPHGVQILKGEERYFRLRQGDYRIIYEINHASSEITIIKVGHRREVYDR